MVDKHKARRETKNPKIVSNVCEINESLESEKV